MCFYLVIDFEININEKWFKLVVWWYDIEKLFVEGWLNYFLWGNCEMIRDVWF